MKEKGLKIKGKTLNNIITIRNVFPFILIGIIVIIAVIFLCFPMSVDSESNGDIRFITFKKYIISEQKKFVNYVNYSIEG